MEAVKAELEKERLKRKVESLEWHLERSHLSQIATNKEQDRMHNELEFYKKKLREAENELQGKDLPVIDKNDKFLDKLKSIEAQYLELKADKEAILKRHEEVIQQMERELEERRCKVEDLQMNLKTIPVPYQDADNVDSEDEQAVGQSVEAIGACWNGTFETSQELESQTALVTSNNSQVEREEVNTMAPTKVPKTLTRQKKKKHQAKLKFSKRKSKSRKSVSPQEGEVEQTEAVAIPPIQLEISSAIESTATTSSLVEIQHAAELTLKAPRKNKMKRQVNPWWSKQKSNSRKTARPQKSQAEQTEAVAIPPPQMEMPSVSESTATASSQVENHHPTELARTAPHKKKRKRATKSGFRGSAMASTHQMKTRRSNDSKQTDPPEVEQHATAYLANSNNSPPAPAQTMEVEVKQHVTAYSATRNTSPTVPAQIMEVGPEPMASHSRTFQPPKSFPAFKKPKDYSTPEHHVVSNVGSDSRFYCACGRHFATKYGLVIHFKQHSGREMLFKCPLPDCNQRFVSGHKMKQHMKKTHEVHNDVLKSYFVVSCGICGRWFQSRATWKQHQTAEGHYGEWTSPKFR